MKYILSSRWRVFLVLASALVLTLQSSNVGAVELDIISEDFAPVTLCHQEGNGDYHDVTVSTSGALQGHEGHEGDIIPAPVEGCESLNEPEEGPQADLVITKVVDEPLPNIGGAVTYGLKVTNNGPDDAVNAFATDTLPPGVTFVMADFPGDYNSATGVWTIGDLGVGESVTLDIYVTANLDAGDTTVVNVATVSADTEDPNTDNNTAQVSIEIGIPQAALQECVAGSAWASKVIFSEQGTLNNGSPIIDPARIDDTETLGAPDSKFFSLGKGGKIKLGFAGFVVDVPGTDVDVYEITNGRDTYPEENALVEISQDGDTWYVIGTASGQDTDGKSSFDISPTGLAWFEFIRLTETSDFSLHDATADGFDVDAVGVTMQECSVGTLQKDGEYNSATGEITYTVTWGVYGSASLDLVITDTLPTGTSYVAGSADNGGIFDAGTQTLTWDLGTQPGGATGSVSFKVTLDAALAMDSWAKTVVSFSQGTAANLTDAVAPIRSNPNSALGVAQTAGGIYDNPLPPLLGEFVSLGFTQASTGGKIVVAFDQPVYFGPGNDIQVFEVTGGDNYPDEQAQIAVSDDNAVWTDVSIVVRDGGVDLGASGQTNFIRITDTSNKAAFEPTADGFDVDAVKALQLVPDICSISNIARLTWLLSEEETSAFTTATSKTTINETTCAEDTYKISGKKWNDKNGNGTPDDGEERLPGWTIYIDANDNGVKDGGETSITTDDTGLYSFVGLEPGMYILREVPQASWAQTFPGPASFGKHVVFVTSFDIPNIWFGNQQTENGQGGGENGGGGGNTPAKGSISGVVYNDTNNNGTRDEGEADLSGWVVYLDANDNGALDGSETSVTTASPYLFSNLDDGTYTIREVVQGGWSQTAPTSLDDYKHVVTITGANSVTGKHFGNFQAPGGGSNSSSSTTGGNGSTPGGPTPTVAGDTTTTPSDANNTNPTDPPAELGGDSTAPAVLGATELPRTGSGNTSLLFAVLLGIAGSYAFRKAKAVYA